MDCVMQEENQHSLQGKQGAGVRRKETGNEESYGHTCSFWKNYTEVWLIFSVALSSAAQQCDSVIHIKLFFSFFHSFSCGLSLNIEYSSLRSTVGLCCFPFLCFPNSQSSTHHILPHDTLMSWPSGFGWTLTSHAAEKTPWYLPEEGNKTSNCTGSGYCGESPVRAHADWCVSLTPPGF